MAGNSYYYDSGFSCWFRDDINNALRAIDLANAEVFTVINTPEMRLYRRGYEAAVRSMAEAFGIHYISPTHYDEEMPAVIEGKPG
jgi:hypothetical protein